MKNASIVLGAIDTALDVPVGSSSSIEELSRYFDPTTTEYVLTLRYRARVPPQSVPVEPCSDSRLIDSILTLQMTRRRT